MRTTFPSKYPTNGRCLSTDLLRLASTAASVSVNSNANGAPPAARSRRIREKSEYQKRLDAFLEKQRLEEEEKQKALIKKLKDEHEYNFQRFVLLKKSYEAGDKDKQDMLVNSVVLEESHLTQLEKAGAVAPTSLADLRGALYVHFVGDATRVNGAMSLYRNVAARVFNCKKSELTGDQVARMGAYLRAKAQADDARKEEDYNGALSLKEWPGMGFDGFTRRKQEELWSLYAPDGSVLRERLPNDCTVIHFAGVGEVITHKAAEPIQKALKDSWATERWKYLTPLDSRMTVADIRRTQGSGAINQIISVIEKIVNQKVEATSSSDADHDYQFRLPYVEPHEGGIEVDLDIDNFRATHEHQFRLSHDAAMNHNNIYPPYRMRFNMSKLNFAGQFLQKLCMQYNIAFKRTNEIEDT